jgi:hypothetical protein
MSLEDVPRCQHVKVNGTQCGSPALRRRRHCYFHHRMLDGKRRFAESQVTPRPVFTMCLLEDANSVQMAIMQVLQLLGSGQMEYKMAGLMLYGLQTASANLRNVRFEAEKPTDVVIDRNTTSQTCLNGPQWFASDFAVQVEEVGEAEPDDAIAASAEPVAAGSTEAVSTEATPVEPRRESRQVRRARARAAMRKRPPRAEIEETPSVARDLFNKIFSNGVPSPVEARSAG